jgi:Fe-Mn family superoxide dismutase
MLQKKKTINFTLKHNNTLFRTKLSPDGGDAPDGELAGLIDETFGGFPAFRQQMTEAATTIQGSGWALASWEPVAERLVVQQVYDHQGNHGQGTVPLLALDVWEHAFYLQYENRKAEYVDAVWNVVDWSDVDARLQKARQ